MKKRSAAIALLLAAAAFMPVSGCSENVKGGGKNSPPIVKGAILQDVATEAIPDNLVAVGTVKARNAALIAARIPGAVSTIFVKEGDRVAKGKLLLTLEANESTAGAAGAKAAVEEARRGVEEALARKRLADTTFERYHKLLQEQAVTRQEFDIRLTDKDTANEGVARAEARLAQARENARAAGTVAGYTRISAPLSGLVTSKSVDAGMTVFPGMPLMTVEEEGRYRLEVSAPESLMGNVKLGQALKVQIDGVTGETEGRVAEVVPAIDPASRTFTVKVDISAGGLRSGIYGRALFPVGERKGVLVPKRAIVERGALTSLWVVDKENIARMRLVKTGREVNERVEVLSGLSGGERVVVGGVEKVVEGARIQ
ncbi:MAG: RND family efflux transporter MFP [Geobacteraceae bacterium]|nr:MAG: RND family efflux transporter MFP [Geobacteraceae bacterium]